MRIVILAAAVIAGLGSPLAAREISAKTTDALAIEAMHNYGGCVANRSPRPAAAILAEDYRTEDYGKRLQRFAEGHGYCVPGGRLAFHRVLFAGALAEQLLEMGRRSDEIPLLLAKVPNPPLQARDETEMMALCTVRMAPAAVAELLKRPVASREEAKAMQALAPTLAGCLAKDQQLSVNRPGLRVILALAAWRIANGSAG